MTLSELRKNRKIISCRDELNALCLLAPNERPAYEIDPLPFFRSLLKWKLFCERAAATGFLSRPEVKRTLAWAWKNEIAQRYLNERLLPVMKRDARIDSVMALFSFWDVEGSLSNTIDSAKLKNHLDELFRRQAMIRYDSLIHPLRRSLRIKFLQDVWTDVKGQDPAALGRKADSLRDAGNTADAYSAYSILAVNYSFAAQGRQAILELAKIQAEQENLRAEAIRNFRLCCISGDDDPARREAMFRIGFIYDRYLDKPDLAEMNYRWILKNAPECRQAQDAEFMLEHLGEPMPGSEELRAEAKRQGR